MDDIKVPSAPIEAKAKAYYVALLMVTFSFSHWVILKESGLMCDSRLVG